VAGDDVRLIGVSSETVVVFVHVAQETNHQIIGYVIESTHWLDVLEAKTLESEEQLIQPSGCMTRNA
jgi:hypothetical protein